MDPSQQNPGIDKWSFSRKDLWKTLPSVLEPMTEREMDKMFENVVTAETLSTWTERDKSKTKGEHSDF